MIEDKQQVLLLLRTAESTLLLDLNSSHVIYQSDLLLYYNISLLALIVTFINSRQCVEFENVNGYFMCS